MASNPAGSILAADFGSVHTRVVLVDLVDGVYRLVARADGRTTAGFPVGDVQVGLDRILQEMSEMTGRTFVSGSGQIITPEQANRSGVDHFVATASMGRPLRAVLVGLMPELSIATALKAVSGAQVEVHETLSLDDGRNEEARLNAILLTRPDLIVIAGGTDKGAREPVQELAEIVRLAVLLTDRQHRPRVLYAGNNDLHEYMQALFADTDVIFYVADNVRPSLDDEQLESARLYIGRAFDEYKEHHGEGFAAIGEMSESGLLPNAQSATIMAEYLGKLRGAGRVTIADVGSASSTVVSWHNGQLEPRIYTNMGLGHNAQSLLQTIGLNAVRRWLPFNASTSEIINYAMNKTLRPGTIPGTLKDGYFEHALLRAIIQTIAQEIGILAEKSDSKIPGLIIGAGAGLTYTGHPGYTSMLLLDALQPTGVTELHADPFGLIATMGAIAQVAPEAVVQLIDSQSLDHLGTSFSLSGKPRLDKTAMRVKIITGHGDKIEQKVDGGHLWIFPLPVGERARVEVRVSRGLNIGGRGRVKLTVEGGSAGLIFDARGRPLPLAATAGRRAAQLPLWVSEATGDPLMEIDPRWLEDIEEDDLEMPLRTRPDREAAADTGDADDLFDLMDDDDDDQDDDQDDTMGISELRDALS